MSLISEALRKAHMEAVRQDRGELRYYIGHGERTPGVPRVSRYGAIMIVLGGLCFASGAALFYFSLHSAPAASISSHPSASVSPLPSSSTPRVASTIATVDAEPNAAAARVEQPKATPKKLAMAVPPAKPRERRIEERRARKSAESEVAVPDATVVEKPATAAPPEPRRMTTTESRRMSRDGFQEGETYGSPVLGPFGSEISLTGITALRGQFVAIVNGSTVRAGTAVGPFVIEEIEARRIRLRYVDITFFVVQ